MDVHVDIPAGVRTAAEDARIMADQLTHKTGIRVSCCQMMVAGVPWGLSKVAFEAHDQPARDVLKKLLELEEPLNATAGARHPRFDHWVMTCDGTGTNWCAIEVEGSSPRYCP